MPRSLMHQTTKSNVSRADKRQGALVICALLALVACSRGSEATPASQSPTSGASSTIAETAASSSPTAVAAEASTPPPRTEGEGGTIPAPAATRGPLEETIERLFLDSLPFALSPESAGLGINAIALLPAAVLEGMPATWLVHTVGLRDFATEQAHRVNIYQQAGEHVVAEVARINLSEESLGADGAGIPDFLAPNAAQQVRIEPSSLWFGIEGGVGAHGGVFDLLRFDPAASRLSIALAANSPSPGVAQVQDVSGHGMAEVIVDASDPYVFCYACSVSLPQVELYRWTGSEMARVELASLPNDAGQEAQQLNQRLIELANAGLWRDVYEALPEADALAVPDSVMAWNVALLSLNADARRATSEDAAAPFPLLSHLFYGDFGGASQVMRAYSPEELFATPSALISGTVAAGWEETLANWIERSTAPALQFDPTLVDGWLARAWGAWLIGDLAESGAWLERAHSLRPDDDYLSRALERVAQPQDAETPHLTALSPVEVRTGPGNSFPIQFTLQPGEVVTITGRFGTAADQWWQIPPRGEGAPGWVRADDARVATLLTEHVPQVVAPAQVAPVAQQGRILYSAEGIDGVAALYEIAAAPAAAPLLLLEEARQPALRAQGDIVAFASDRADMLGIGGINLHTGERLRYTFNLEDGLPRWNGVGDQIVFSSTREGDRRARIYRSYAGGAVNAQTLRLGQDADWNQLDGRIVFKGCDGSGNNCGLWVMQGEGTNAVSLTNNPGDSRPRWSPEGTRVLFMSDQRDGNWELYEVALATGDVTRMTDAAGEDGLPIYSPTGSAIAWIRHNEEGWALIVRQANSAVEMTIHDFGADFPNWLDQGLDWIP